MGCFKTFASSQASIITVNDQLALFFFGLSTAREFQEISPTKPRRCCVFFREGFGVLKPAPPPKKKQQQPPQLNGTILVGKKKPPFWWRILEWRDLGDLQNISALKGHDSRWHFWRATFSVTGWSTEKDWSLNLPGILKFLGVGYPPVARMDIFSHLLACSTGLLKGWMERSLLFCYLSGNDKFQKTNVCVFLFFLALLLGCYGFFSENNRKQSGTVNETN